MSTLDIEPSDVIRLVEQYLKENNLFKTLQCLQDETSVSLNTVDSVETFVQDINSGRWDVVLKVVKLLKLPDNKLIDLYEQIAIELMELREMRAATWLIYKTEPMQRLKSTSPDRFLHLQTLLKRPFFDYKEAYRDGVAKERRRNMIASALKKEVSVVPPQRLLTLISDALKWQKHEGLLASGTSIDIFTGKAHMVAAEEETYPNMLHRHCIKSVVGDEFSIMVCCAEFSPDGQYIILGYNTGLLEIRNPTTGKMANDLKFQAIRNYIVTPRKDAALSICFSTSELLAVGDDGGHISIWRLTTGQLIQVFESVHQQAISCLLFHRNGKEILSGSLDKTVKLHGMRSNKTIREFQGHTSFVTAICFSKDDNYVISGSFDCTVKIWKVLTAQVIQEYKSPAKINSIIPMPKELQKNFKTEVFLVGSQSHFIHLIDLDGKVRLQLTSDDKSDADEDEETKPGNFYSICSSPKGNWIYGVDSRRIYCFNYSTKKVQKRLVAHDERKDNDVVGIRHHPFYNLLVTYDTQGNLKLWKP